MKNQTPKSGWNIPTTEQVITTKKELKSKVIITPPVMNTVPAKIVGTAPYLSNNMSSRAIGAMREGQVLGTTNRGIKKKRDPKNFDEIYMGSLHVSTEGWYGIPCSAFRSAMITACSAVGFQMTRAKLYIFVEPDGRDAQTGDGLVRIYGNPVKDERIGRLATGVADILTRARFDKWQATVSITYDSDALQLTDVLNLLMRAGVHVGVGAGRPASRSSTGIGMGTFKVVE